MPLPRLIPRTVLFGNPEKASPQLSPDGSRLAYLAPLDGVLNVWVGDPSGDAARPVTNDRDRGIRVYTWAHDGDHLLYLQDQGGDENWRLYAVNPERGDERLLTPFDDVQVQIIQHEKRHPHELLIGLNREDPRAHDVYRLDLRRGDLHLVAKNPGDVLGWVPDAELRVRGAVASLDDGGMELKLRSKQGDAWDRAIHWAPEDALTSAPVGFSLDGRHLYLQDSRNANAARLVKWEIGTTRYGVLAEDSMYDVSSVVRHPDTLEPELAGFERARFEWQALDPPLERDLAAIGDFQRGDFALVDRTHADDQWLVLYQQDLGPAAYWAYDRRRQTGKLVFVTRPALAEYQLAAMEPISFTARDGLAIHGYLTVPSGVAAPLPMVLLVHGGPWHRDTWGYDPEVQWLANRGYAVLQVNFRGSTGYGKRFLNAGDREWGGRMHNDLVDAVRWAVDRGTADPDRVAIYGGSYGGYAALVGATATPELFRCAVDIVGPSNLITFIDSIPPYWSAFRSMLHRRVGHPERDRDFLVSRSPLTHVDRIRIPMLIAQGANDPRVKQAESEQVVAAMREKGIDHEYLLFPDEGHGFAKPANRLKFYAAAEQFLARHLGGRCETED